MAIGPLGEGHIFLYGFRQGYNFFAQSLGRVKIFRFFKWTNIGALPLIISDQSLTYKANKKSPRNGLEQLQTPVNSIKWHTLQIR